MSERLCVVMPVYNEQEAIGPVLEKWAKALDDLGVDYVIRPYNDGSKDRSLEVMRTVAAHLPHVEVRDKKNGGHGNTILTGYRDAAADGFDWIFQIDSDDEMGPEKFEELWTRRNDYDFLVGIRDGRVQALPRKIISFVSRCCVKLFYGRKTVWDVNTPYRLMRTSAFNDIFAAIPLSTFAPNVIISGMVARKGLRFFETRVPQHDRTTGEVSIKKWKLLKAASRSFWQTICFSFSQRSGGHGGIAGVLTSLLAFLFVLMTLNSTSVPWFDEIGTADTAINCVINGKWVSHVWPYSYNPLHIHLLTGWLWIFGVSHFSVCAFGVMCALLTSFVMQRVLIRVGVLRAGWQNILFALAFWFGSWQFSRIITNGRIDMLTAACAIWLVAELTAISARYSSLRVCAAAFFTMLAAVYPIPLLVFFGMYILIFPLRGETRGSVVRKGLFAGLGVLLAFIVSCGYYAYHQSLLRFLHTYFSFNATVSGSSVGFMSRVMTAYSHDVFGLGLLAVSAVILFCKKRESAGIWRWVAFVAMIPILCVIGGRYEGYYSWMFYLSSLSCFLVAIESSCNKIMPWLLGGVVMIAVGRYVVYLPEWSASLKEVDKVERFVEGHPDLFKSGRRVLISKSIWYYPVLRSGATIWSDERFVDAEHLTPQQKFEGFLRKRIADSATRDRLMRVFLRLQKPEEELTSPYFSCKEADLDGRVPSWGR